MRWMATINIKNKDKHEFLGLPRDGLIYWATYAHASSEGGEIRAPFIYQQIPMWLLEMYIFRSNRTCNKSTCSPVFSNQIFQMEICHLFVQWTSWIPASGFYRHLSGKWISFVQMIHMVRERNLPYIGFVFHLKTVSPLVCLAM